MAKKLIAFDLDDTLAISKTPITDRMGELLVALLDHYDVCVISGGRFEQFKIQIIDRIEAEPRKLGRMHLMPTCGTRYYRYDQLSQDWKLQYSEDLTDAEKTKITEVLKSSAEKFKIWPTNPFGEVIEDRGSQVTYSALGQQAPAEFKYKWAKENDELKKELRKHIAAQLPELEVRLGGTTSVDITRIGIDKAYGMHKLIDALDASKEEILFIGDKLQEGGNDYPVKAMGIDCIEVDGWEETALVVEGILAVTP